MGIEALSRGAHSATFIEKNRPTCHVLQNNLKTLNIKEKTKILCLDVPKGLTKCQGTQYDICYIDPPYATKKDEPVIFEIVQALDTLNLVKEGGLVFAEDRTNIVKEAPSFDTIQYLKKKTFGDTIIWIFKRGL